MGASNGTGQSELVCVGGESTSITTFITFSFFSKIKDPGGGQAIKQNRTFAKKVGPLGPKKRYNTDEHIIHDAFTQLAWGESFSGRYPWADSIFIQIAWQHSWKCIRSIIRNFFVIVNTCYEIKYWICILFLDNAAQEILGLARTDSPFYDILIKNSIFKIAPNFTQISLEGLFFLPHSISAI
jgi:hypothetical protein